VKEPATQHSQSADGREGSRALVISAVAVSSLYVAAMVALGTPPGTADTGVQVVAWFPARRGGSLRPHV